MTLHTIRLPGGEWEYDNSKALGQAGGFGEVFIGIGECGDVAIKRLCGLPATLCLSCWYFWSW